MRYQSSILFSSFVSPVGSVKVTRSIGTDDTVSHIFYGEVQVASGNCTFGDQKSRSLLIDNMDGCHSGLSSLGAYTYIITAVASEIFLSKIERKCADFSMTMRNIGLGFKFKMVVDRVTVFSVLNKFQTGDRVEPFFFLSRIVVDMNGYGSVSIFIDLGIRRIARMSFPNGIKSVVVLDGVTRTFPSSS